MFDTHCHLNFSRFKKNLSEVVNSAFNAGVAHFLVPGTDIKTSNRAVQIAKNFKNIYCAVGVHPHHVFSYLNFKTDNLNYLKKDELIKIIDDDLVQIEKLALSDFRVLAIGEVGIDKHQYDETKYLNYEISNDFIRLQKYIFIKQIEISIRLNKSLIVHNREAKDELLQIMREKWSSKLSNRVVFHCCEADSDILEFALSKSIFIGVNGDVTYDKRKQDFIKRVPVDLLVVETDSPFLLPEPLLSLKKYPNEPKNLPLIIKAIASLKGLSDEQVAKKTFENGKKLFNIV